MLEVHTVQLSDRVVNKIVDHAQREADKGGYEAVGFVATKNGKGTAILPLHNHASDPQHAFFVEPWEQFRAERKLEDGGFTILGIYHSHVNSEAMPSATDHQMAWPGSYVFIYSVVFRQLKAYKETDGILEPAELMD